jgi:hypothetical protein
MPLGLDPWVDTGSREENASKQEIAARFCRIRAEQAPRLVRQRLSWRAAAFTVGRHPAISGKIPTVSTTSPESRAHDHL